jgi:hypothetical protein
LARAAEDAGAERPGHHAPISSEEYYRRTFVSTSISPRNLLWNFLPTLRFSWDRISACLPIASALSAGRLQSLFVLLKG